jgi:hypothetical protein
MRAVQNAARLNRDRASDMEALMFYRGGRTTSDRNG